MNRPPNILTPRRTALYPSRDRHRGRLWRVPSGSGFYLVVVPATEQEEGNDQGQSRLYQIGESRVRT
jgi:hypothetical protein